MEGRPRRSFTDDYKGQRSIWWLRAVARSDRWPRNWACAIRSCFVGEANGCPADQAAEIARLQRENERLVNPASTDMPVLSFGTFTQDLHDLADWFGAWGVTSVAMESTGIY